MSKIQAELAKATGVNPEAGQSIVDPAYMKKLVRAVANLPDKDWDALSGPAQEHHNAAADAANAKKDIPNFPDYVAPAADETPRRRRAAEDDDAPAAKAYAPKKGDEVEIVTSRDKVVVGKVVDPDDAGDLVLEVDGEEVGYSLAKLKSITPKNAPAEDEKPRRRRAAEDDDDAPPAKAEPEVGDTVEVENSRGTKKMGNIVEMDDEVLVIKDAAGEEIEYAREKVKSIVVKVKNAKKADEAPKRRGKAEDADDDKGDGKKDGKPARVGKEANGGVSVTTRLRELMCETPLDPLSLEDLGKAIKKEGLACNDSTMKMVHADCVKLFKMLAAGKHLK